MIAVWISMLFTPSLPPLYPISTSPQEKLENYPAHPQPVVVFEPLVNIEAEL